MRKSTRTLRLQSLAAATLFAFSALGFAGDDGARIHLDALAEGIAYDRFIVKFRDGTPEHAEAGARERVLAAAARGQGLQLGHLRRLAIGADLVEVSSKLPPQAAEALMRALARNPNVEYVEPDAVMRPLLTPNDTRYPDQWHYFEATGGVNLPAAWDRSTGSGVVVAVLDTGSTAHSDLDGNTVAGYDFISSSTTARDGNGRDSNPRDEGDWVSANECGYTHPAQNSSWHGTHVAGTIGAVTNNAKGVAGVAFGAKIQHVRVLGRCGGSLSDIADAIVWASGGSVSGVPANATPAEVINMSLGGSGSCGSTYQAAIDSAVNRGSVVVVAAGNDNVNVSNARPANCNNVIAVAATDRNGARASFSNYGSLIDVSAPGVGIWSTLNSGTTTPGSESYAAYNGTSMATPHVAGIVALMQSVAPKTPAQVEQILKDTARPLPGACSGGCGAGIVDALAAVNAAIGGGGNNQLQNGVPVTGLAASTGNSLNYTMQVPAGATNLQFAISGGTGDADLYVKYGSAPTDSSYDCRPYKSGNNESCSFATPAAGTWHVRVKAYSSFSGVSLTGSFTPPSSAPCTGCTKYSGSLSGSGSSQIQPDGTHYQSTVSGVHEGWLKGPAGSDFDLELYRWNGSSWSRVARAASSSSDEYLSYSGTAGYYYWRIVSYSGSGSYDFWLKRP
ncbi:serine protease [Rehaibacterium terrae]|jgi:serine protease|uniref:Serine protease n=1 Tax=Rehaibacterium terrae TaxID=1341696 RepID=A0A7W7Y1U3_9GAMM|nr:serine protease [Rehaibacterium terrae]